MNNDRVKGAIDEAVGSAKRHVGSMTGNTRIEVEGAVQQVKGKFETTVGKVKDAVHEAKDHIVAQNRKDEEAKHAHDEVILVKEAPIL